MRGNTNNKKTATDTAYIDAANMRDTTFQAVMKLKSHSSLFQWKSVSNIPLGALQKALDEMTEWVSSLSPKPSPDEISNLERA